MARRCNGTSDFGAAPVANTSLVTISVWLRVIALPASLFHEPLTFCEAPGDTTQDKSLRLYSSGQMHGMVYTGANTESNGLAVTTGVWQHWALIADGTNITVYRDGTASTPVAAASSYTGYATPEITIGRGLGGFVQTDVAELAVWDVALSAGNVTTLAGGAVPSSLATSDIIDYWSLVADGSALNGNTMTFTGTTLTDHPPVGSAAPIVSPLRVQGPSYAAHRAASI